MVGCFHNEPAVNTTSGRAWLLCSIIQERAHKHNNSFHNQGMEEGRTCFTVRKQCKNPRTRLRGDIVETIFMRDIHNMGYAQDQIISAHSVKLGLMESRIFGSAPLFQINLV